MFGLAETIDEEILTFIVKNHKESNETTIKSLSDKYEKRVEIKKELQESSKEIQNMFDALIKYGEFIGFLDHLMDRRMAAIKKVNELNREGTLKSILGFSHDEFKRLDYIY